MTVVLLLLTGVAAVVDWYAVVRTLHRVELIAKPLTLVLLIAAAATADFGSAKLWVIAALVLGLAGDVALMFSNKERTDAAFLLGLGSFLAGHVSYLVAFSRHGLQGVQLVAGVLIVVGASGLALPPVLRGAQRSGGRELVAAVGTYAGTLGAMAALAIGTGALATAFGGGLFLASDTALAWQRFVRPINRGPLLVIVTYHLAQVLIVVGLLR